MTKERAEIGVFGGSGFYSLLGDAREVAVETPYGAPSDRLALGEVAGRRVAFLPRHGQAPRISSARRQLSRQRLGHEGTRRRAHHRAGRLRFTKGSIKPGDMLVADQLVDFTSGRKDTYYDGPIATHVSFADPYCPQLRTVATAALRKFEDPAPRLRHGRGRRRPALLDASRVALVHGNGWDVINMTQYPEAYLARELEMCYVNISLVTDYDVGLEGDRRSGGQCRPRA